MYQKSRGNYHCSNLLFLMLLLGIKLRTDILANYIAHRLSEEQGQNWWGTAQNLQDLNTNPWLEAVTCSWST